jgi:hypothetical protein
MARGSIDTWGGGVWGTIAECHHLYDTDADGREWTANGTPDDNARLIAAAGTAAHECAEMGYDPIEAVRALPELICHLKRLQRFAEDAPRCDFKEDQTLSWVNYETAEVRKLLDRAAGRENG